MTLSLIAPSSLDNGAPFIRTEKEDEWVEPWEAHLRTLEDDKVWDNEEKWREFRREINIIPQEELTKIRSFGPVIFKKIMECRPYFSMEEVREVEGVGEKRYRRLAERCWCF